MDHIHQIAELVRMVCPDMPVHLKFTPTRANSLVGSLNAFASAESFTVVGLGQHILRQLGQRQQSPGCDGSGAWLYPRLTMLDLENMQISLPVGDIREWVKERWVKYRPIGGKSKQPNGSVEVTMPYGKGGRTEYWKPVGKKRPMKEKGVVPDDAE